LFLGELQEELLVRLLVNVRGINDLADLRQH
jgi:hypothetical protein